MPKLVGRPGERSRRVRDADIALILAHMQSGLPMDDLIGFAVDRAMRLGEVVRVRWDDPDLDKRKLVIRDRKRRGLHSAH